MNSKRLHLHLLLVGPERPAACKLLAEEVLVPDVKAAEDLNLRQVTTASAARCSMRFISSRKLTCRELIVPSVGYRQPHPTKPVGAAKVVWEVGQFGPKVLGNWMLCDIDPVFIGRFKGNNGFSQAAKPLYLPETLQTPCQK